MTEGRLPLAEPLRKAGDGDLLRSVAEAVLQLLMGADVEGLIGAGRHERSPERLNWRNGYRERAPDTRLGSLRLRIPKLLRQGSSFPPLLEPRKTGEEAPVAVIQGRPGAGPRSTGSAASRPAGWTSWSRPWAPPASPGARSPSWARTSRRARRGLPEPAAGGRVALPVARRALPPPA